MNKPSPLVIIIAAAGIILALLAFWFGAILPFRKAQSFIEAQKLVPFMQSVDDFERSFDRVFDLRSPVGEEETVKFLASSILSIIKQGQEETVARRLVAYIEPRLLKDEVRHFLLASELRQALWRLYGSEEDYHAAADHLEKARAIGPNLPPSLYGLFQLYAEAGDTENAARMRGVILEKWPDAATSLPAS